MDDILKKSDQLSNLLADKPYIVFSDKQSRDISNQLKESLKELNDFVLKKQKHKPPRAQELFIKGFDEEQIWAQLKSNDDLMNGRTDKLISNILGSQGNITLFPGQKLKPAKLSDDEEDELDIEDEEDEDIDEEGDEYDEEDIEGMEGPEGEEDEDELEDVDEEQGEIGGEDEWEDGDEEGAEDRDENDVEGAVAEYLGEDYNPLQMDHVMDEIEGMDGIDLDEDEEGLEGDEDLFGEEDEDESEEEGAPKKQIFRGLVAEEDEDDEDEQAAPKGKRKKFDDAGVEDDVFERAREDLLADDDDEVERQHEAEKQHDDEISALEDRLINKKSWQVKGEIKGRERPLNSLLEETLDFELKAKPSKILTKEYTHSLEAMIQQRILDEAWDDPVQYSMDKPIRETFSNLNEINFEKSAKGLAEIMEDKYKKDVMKIQTATPQDDIQKECDVLFKKLCYNLDVLSNFEFTPKYRTESAKIVANVASIQLEEKTPLGFSMAQQKAPQELFNPNKVQFRSNEDMEKADRNAIRNTNKRNARQRKKEQHQKDLIKKLEHKGQTKFEHNLIQKGISNYKQQVSKKNQQSVKFTKSNQFFENMEKTKESNKKGAAQPAPEIKKKNYKL